MSFTAPLEDMLFAMTQQAPIDGLAGSHTDAAQVPRRAVALEAAIRGARDGEGAVARREDQF